MIQTKHCGVLVLAAGLGKRMCSEKPKVLHDLKGKPLLYHILSAVTQALPHAYVGLIVGAYRSEIQTQVQGWIQTDPLLQSLKVDYLNQSQPLGTGHAVRCAVDSAWFQSQDWSSLVILPGDAPLIQPNLIQALAEPLQQQQAMRLLTCDLNTPEGYGRVILEDSTGQVTAIREEKDLSDSEKAIHTVATSMYGMNPQFLKKALADLSSHNAQGEYYLTDLVQIAVQSKKEVVRLHWYNAEEVRGVNTLWELAEADRILNLRLLKFWALRGVRFLDPWTTSLEVSVQLSEGVVIDAGVRLYGKTTVGKKSQMGPQVILRDVVVGEQVKLLAGTIAEQTVIGSFSQVGPYAHLRPQTILGEYVKIGNFVELKKTHVGSQTKIAHLSYLGDAEVGQQVNIGCGFITCNYDGRVIQGERKHRTWIEDHVFLGSDCQAVAPVRIGKGAFIAAGSTITQDVPAYDLAIARARQVNKLGYAKRLKALIRSKE